MTRKYALVENPGTDKQEVLCTTDDLSEIQKWAKDMTRKKFKVAIADTETGLEVRAKS